jgi:putative phosphoesterase
VENLVNKATPQHTTVVGVIADTHGKLSPGAIQALKGVELIIHAGDIDTNAVLEQLKRIAPVKAVRGNMDRRSGLPRFPTTEVVEVGEVRLYVLHNIEDLDINPKAAGFDAVIFGHSHQPENKDRSGVLFLNPGSASSPRRGTKPSLARLYIQGKNIQVEMINLKRMF